MSARRVAETLVASWLPGALLGAHFGLLLFFLNPRLEISGSTLARAVVVYAILLGAVGSLAILPWAQTRQRVLRVLPWGLTLALVTATMLAWMHVSRYAYFLPAAINERWIKGAVWLSLSSLVCFYTALLHSVAHRPYGMRSRFAFWLLSVLSVVVVAERRLAYVPLVEPELGQAQPVLERPSPPGRLLVVAVEAATLDAILPLAQQGALPFFHRLLEQGSVGRLSSLRPNRRGPLWATLSTGKLPHKHGVVGRRLHSAPLVGPDSWLALSPMQPWASLAQLGGVSQGVDRRTLRAPTLWEVLPRFGISTGVVDWPLSFPVDEAEPAALRFLLSDRYFDNLGTEQAVWPPDLGDRARLFRLRASDLDPARLQPFGPNPAAGAALALAKDRWRASLAGFFLDEAASTEAIFVMLPGLAEVTDRYFGGFVAAEFEGRHRAPYDAAALAVRAYYSTLDATLAEMWQRRDGGTLAIVSAYGAESATGWRWVRAEMSRQRSLEADFHRSPDGVFFLFGEGIRAGQRLEEARLIDVAPTLLYSLGVPIARDLDGQVLRSAFEPAFFADRPFTFVPSYSAFMAKEGG